MRPLWNAVSFLAVVNLLALLLVAAWLWQSGRITGERVGDVRRLLSTTAQQAKAAASQSVVEAEAERIRAAEERIRQHPPADSATQIQQIALVHEEREQVRRRLEDERRVLAGQLADAASRMEAGAEALRQEQAGREQSSAAAAQRKTDEQFLRAVKQLEQISPKQAKRFLEALASRQETDQAVAYLDAMTPRAAAKVLREFKTDGEMRLATELLEGLRTRGLAPAGTMAPPAANIPAAIAAQNPPDAAAAANSALDADAG
jgi:hypothetical protein